MTSPVDIRPDHLEIVQGILREHLPADVKVWVFGSRASWTTKDSSDLDLALEGESKLSLKVLGALNDAFENSPLPYTVDVVDLHRIGESFRRIVGSQKVSLPLDGHGTGHTPFNGWREVTLGDLIDIGHGFAFKGQFIHDETRGDVLLTPGNFAIGGGFKGDKFKYYDGPVEEEYVLQEGDLLVTMTDLSKQSDTLGYPAIVPPCRDERRYLHNQRLGKVLPKDPNELHTRYIYYLMCSAEYCHEVLASATGTTVKHTSPDRIGKFRFNLPPLPEQRAIAHILGTLDDKIELNRQMNKTLEEMARALFRSWFVDFEPVRAKMDGRWRRGESLPGLPAEHYDLFPDRLVDSEMGDIPEGWEVRELGDVIEIHDSKRIPLNSRQRANRQGPYPYYGAAGIMDYVDDYLFDGLYVLIGEDGSVVDNEVYPVVQYVWGQFWVNNHAHVLRAKLGVSLEQLYLFLKQTIIVPYVTGAVQPKLSQTNLCTAPFLLPTPEVCLAFVNVAEPLFQQIRSKANESLAFAAQRDVLLPGLVSGEVMVESTK